MAELGYPGAGTFIEFTNSMTYDDGETLSSWVWYKIRGTLVEGAALTKTTDAGVRSHWLTYHLTPEL